MSLTNQESQTLATAIRASAVPLVVAALAIRDDVTLMNWCNTVRSPNLLAWKTSVPPQSSDEAPDYSTFDNLVAGKRDSWKFFLTYNRNFTRNKVRKWVTDIWGNATAASNAEAILLAATENMTNVQEILGTGSQKTTGTVTAYDRVFDSSVTLTEVSEALNKF